MIRTLFRKHQNNIPFNTAPCMPYASTGRKCVATLDILPVVHNMKRRRNKVVNGGRMQHVDVGFLWFLRFLTQETLSLGSRCINSISHGRLWKVCSWTTKPRKPHHRQQREPLWRSTIPQSECVFSSIFAVLARNLPWWFSYLAMVSPHRSRAYGRLRKIVAKTPDPWLPP